MQTLELKLWSKRVHEILESERMPEDWTTVLVSAFKKKGHMQCCGNYSGHL